MLRLVIGFLTIYLAFVLETSVLSQLGCGQFMPRLTVCAIAALAWGRSPRRELLGAAVVGLVADGLVRGPLGVNVVGYVLAAWCLQSLQTRAVGRSSLVVGLVTGGLTTALIFGTSALRGALTQASFPWGELAVAALASGIATTPMAVVASWLTSRLRGSPREQEPSPHVVSNQWRMLTS